MLVFEAHCRHFTCFMCGNWSFELEILFWTFPSWRGTKRCCQRFGLLKSPSSNKHTRTPPLPNTRRLRNSFMTSRVYFAQCYYIGGTDDAATTMVNDVARPLSNHIPVSNVCKKLKKKDSQICELKYGWCLALFCSFWFDWAWLAFDRYKSRDSGRTQLIHKVFWLLTTTTFWIFSN